MTNMTEFAAAIRNKWTFGHRGSSSSELPIREGSYIVELPLSSLNTEDQLRLVRMVENMCYNEFCNAITTEDDLGRQYINLSIPPESGPLK